MFTPRLLVNDPLYDCFLLDEGSLEFFYVLLAVVLMLFDA